MPSKNNKSLIKSIAKIFNKKKRKKTSIPEDIITNFKVKDGRFINDVQKNIVIAGMTQSGSTLLFNIVRQYYENKSLRVVSANYRSHTIYIGDVLIMKVHHYSRNIHKLADIIFSTKRDIRDATASFYRKSQNKNKFIDKNFTQYVTENTDLYNAWREYSNYEFVYESYKKDPVNTIIEIVKTLGEKISKKDAKTIQHSIEAMKDEKSLPNKDDSSNYYKKTFFTKAHITNTGVKGYLKTLSKEQIRYIEKNYCDYLVE